MAEGGFSDFLNVDIPK